MLFAFYHQLNLNVLFCFFICFALFCFLSSEIRGVNRIWQNEVGKAHQNHQGKLKTQKHSVNLRFGEKPCWSELKCYGATKHSLLGKVRSVACWGLSDLPVRITAGWKQCFRKIWLTLVCEMTEKKERFHFQCLPHPQPPVSYFWSNMSANSFSSHNQKAIPSCMTLFCQQVP